MDLYKILLLKILNLKRVSHLIILFKKNLCHKCVLHKMKDKGNKDKDKINHYKIGDRKYLKKEIQGNKEILLLRGKDRKEYEVSLNLDLLFIVFLLILKI